MREKFTTSQKGHSNGKNTRPTGSQQRLAAQGVNRGRYTTAKKNKNPQKKGGDDQGQGLGQGHGTGQGQHVSLG